MTKIWVALAAMAATAAPLMAVDRSASSAASTVMAAPVIIGLDRPILLKRMVVTATALPDGAG
ncbi:MAG: hypothetical protein QHC40_09360 [Sphingobium sp.]|nr:hypothetical protein [Sphingobium sp.]